MTIHLPHDLEEPAARRRRRRTLSLVDDAMTQAARLLLQRQPRPQAPARDDADPLLGSMADAADELDAIVAEAMGRRRQPWRDIPVE